MFVHNCMGRLINHYSSFPLRLSLLSLSRMVTEILPNAVYNYHISSPAASISITLLLLTRFAQKMIDQKCRPTTTTTTTTFIHLCSNIPSAAGIATTSDQWWAGFRRHPQLYLMHLHHRRSIIPPSIANCHTALFSLSYYFIFRHLHPPRGWFPPLLASHVAASTAATNKTSAALGTGIETA